MNLQAKEINDFWFGPLTQGQPAESVYVSRWFKKDPDFDQMIKQRFEPLVQQAAQDQLKSWESNSEERLALIILLDQFPRNLYRNSSKAWSYDPVALNHALAAIEQKQDLALHPTQRSFVYMPLMHSEDLKIQKLSVEKFEQLAQDAEAPLKKGLEGNLNFAKKHAEIIKRFGRYPHRNEILGRESTIAEQRFLEQPGSSF